MSRYTEGSWEKTQFAKDVVVKDGQGGYFRICSIVQHIGKAQKEDEANAQLIAAAPDLLAACKDAQVSCESMRMECAYPLDEELADIASRLEAAIAKATE